LLGIIRIETNTTSVTRGEVDRSLLTPSGSPGVLDLPVSGLVLGGQQHGVVDVQGAVLEEPALVEGPVGGVHTDGNRHLLQGSAQLAAVTLRELDDPIDLVGSALDLAGPVSGRVRIILGLHHSLILDVLHTTRRPTTIASHVSVLPGAIN